VSENRTAFDYETGTPAPAAPRDPDADFDRAMASGRTVRLDGGTQALRARPDGGLDIPIHHGGSSYALHWTAEEVAVVCSAIGGAR